MSLGNIALVGVIIAAIVYIAVIVMGMIAFFPFGLIGLVILFFIGALLYVVVNQKLRDDENRHYEKNVKE